MSQSRKKGAVLGLVIALAFFMIILGIGFYYIARLIGGHRELEHATDAGNLQVAKKALRSPVVNAFATNGYAGPFDLSGNTLTEVQKNFSQLADPNTGQIDLLVYNRLVAQAFLVALNAAADGYDTGTPPSPFGIARAQRLIQILNDPASGVGVTLARKLKLDPVLDTNFTGIADDENTLRMLKANGETAAISDEKDISFMARGFASNAFLDRDVLAGMFPADFLQNIAGFDNNFYVKNGVSYLVGYQFLNVPGVTDAAANALVSVPLRPGEFPHLVDGTDFTNLQVSPEPGSDADVKTSVPPNAFRSSGLGQDGRTKLFTQAASCALAGSILLAPAPGGIPNNPFSGDTIPPGGPYPIEIPNGFIAVANGGGTDPVLPAPPGPIGFSGPQCLNASVSQNQTLDTFATLLMAGDIFVAPSNVGGSIEWAVATDSNCISALIAAQQAHIATYGTRLHDAELANAAACLDNPDRLTVADNIDINSTQQQCNNINSYPDAAMGGQQPNQSCIDALPTVTKIFGGTSGSTGQTYCLSALEFDEATVISERANDGSAFIQPFNSCTGLDAFPLNPNQFSNDSIQKSPPSINQLIGPAGTLVAYGSSGIPGATTTAVFANKVYNDFLTRVNQVKPTVTASEVSNIILNTPVPLGTVMYVWVDTSQNPGNPTLRFTTADQLPPRINPNSVSLDGTPVTATTDYTPPGGGTQKLALISDSGGGGNGYLDRNGDGGYPHPFDCAPFGTGTVTSSAVWTPSSGFDDCLGVLRFENCVNSGGGINMDCPC
jgi:hypothetical protein